MLFVLLALGIALLCIGAAPSLLTLSPWQIRHPGIALTLWFTAFLLGALALLLATVFAVSAGLASEHSDGHWQSIADTVAAWLSLAVLGGFLGLILTVNEPLIEQQRRTRSQLNPLIVSEDKRSGLSLVTFASDEELAVAFAGRPKRIFLATTLWKVLNHEQLQAVIAHEYAHLQLRHNWLMRISEVNARLLPRLKAGQQLRRATLLLIELVADNRAAKQVGPAALANALTRLARQSNDPSLELRAERLTQQRWPHSSRRHIPRVIQLAAPNTKPESR